MGEARAALIPVPQCRFTEPTKMDNELGNFHWITESLLVPAGPLRNIAKVLWLSGGGHIGEEEA